MPSPLLQTDIIRPPGTKTPSPPGRKAVEQVRPILSRMIVTRGISVASLHDRKDTVFGLIVMKRKGTHPKPLIEPTMPSPGMAKTSSSD